MSFSAEVKKELSTLSNLANKEVVKYEFLGYLSTNHINIEESKKSNCILKFSTENEYNINRFGKLLNNLEFNNYEIKITGKTFYITMNAPELEEITYKNKELVINKDALQSELENKELLQKAFVRGIFLGSGAINNPKSSNHLEIMLLQKEIAEFVLEILKNYNILLKQLEKKQGYSLYAKDGEEISKFLAFIGANNSVLKFEEIRVYRDIVNNVNRKVNCETANLNKIVNSAIKQIEAIEYLEKMGELKKLSPALQEIAELRIMHPEASLTELGTMLKKPIGKSGVNHRLKAIEQKAEELKGK